MLRRSVIRCCLCSTQGILELVFSLSARVFHRQASTFFLCYESVEGDHWDA